MVTGVKLIAFAKKYFKCIEINGIKIEEIAEGNGCGDLIHWNSRILLGDYMTVFSYVQYQVISEFTLNY